jgi:hypothetical protein
MDSVNSSSSASISASVSVMNEQRRASLQPTLINATMANPNTILNAFDNMDVDQSFASTQIPTPLATSHKTKGTFFFNKCVSSDVRVAKFGMKRR